MAEEVKTYEDTTEIEFTSLQARLTRFVRQNIYDIAIVLVCIARIVFGLADIQKSGKSVLEILADGAITLVFSITLSRLLEGKGLIAGEKSTEFQRALEEYRETADKASKWLTELDDWCLTYTETLYKSKLTTMLLSLGISYEQYTKNEYDESAFTDEQKKHLVKIKKMKVQRLTAGKLLSGELETDREIDYEKTTKRNYVKRSTGGDFVSKIILSVVFGYFTLPPIAQWDWAGAVWALLHTSLILGLSIVKYFNAYNFVNEDLRAKLIDKKHKLNIFIKQKGE